ncbi:hypothetical protein ACWZEH_33380 [Streptomyces sp. QTS137]
MTRPPAFTLPTASGWRSQACSTAGAHFDDSSFCASPKQRKVDSSPAGRAVVNRWAGLNR